jgi:hypothetical protein
MRREILVLEGQLRDAKALLNEETNHSDSTVVLRTRPIRPRSSVWWALHALRHAKKPLHVDELVRRIQEFSGHTVRKTTLVGNLSRYVRSHDTFARIEEGVYGLLDDNAGQHAAEDGLARADATSSPRGVARVAAAS